MEGCKVPDKVILSAVSEVEDGVHGLVHVGARGVHRHRDGTLPPGQEGLEVVEECEVSSALYQVCRIRKYILRNFYNININYFNVYNSDYVK